LDNICRRKTDSYIHSLGNLGRTKRLAIRESEMLKSGIKLAAVLGFAGVIALSIASAEARNARKKTDRRVVTTGQTTYPSSVRRSYGLDYRGSSGGGGGGLMMGYNMNGGPA
jgi:hypothetical protein